MIHSQCLSGKARFRMATYRIWVVLHKAHDRKKFRQYTAPGRRQGGGLNGCLDMKTDRGKQKEQRVHSVERRVHCDRRKETAGSLVNRPQCHRKQENCDRCRPLGQMHGREEERGE